MWLRRRNRIYEGRRAKQAPPHSKCAYGKRRGYTGGWAKSQVEII
jgi:hypothetical protein